MTISVLNPDGTFSITGSGIRVQSRLRADGQEYVVDVFRLARSATELIESGDRLMVSLEMHEAKALSTHLIATLFSLVPQYVKQPAYSSPPLEFKKLSVEDTS